MVDPIVTDQDPAPGPPTPADPPRRWRNSEAREAIRKRRTVAVAALLAVATVAGLVATAGWFRPVRRPALVLIGGPAGSPTDFAPVPFAEADRNALADLGLFLPAVGPTSVEAGLARLRLDEVGAAGTLVVHVRARIWADPLKGKASPALRFAKDGVTPMPGRPAEGASLSELFTAIGANRAARQLLILDLLPPPDAPRLGASAADVGTLVAEEARQAVVANPRLAILASCDPRRGPAASEALGRSVFGFFVDRGLRGEADASGDGRVSVRELAAFVASRVDRWAARVFDSEQKPILYTGQNQGDFPLALVPRRPPVPAGLPDAKEVPTYPTWLLDAWRERDAWRKLGVESDAPRVFEQAEAALLLAEQSWRGKLDESRVRADLVGRMERLRDRIGPTRTIPHPRPRSLAQEASFGASADPDVLKMVREIVAKRADPKPGEANAATTEFASSAKFKTDFDRADAVFRIGAEDPAPAREAIAFLDHLLLARQPRPLYAETLALHRLAGLPPADWSPATARLALALAVRGEALQARPASAIGSSQLLDDADRLRHEAESLLIWPGYASPSEVDRRLAEALVATDSAAGMASTIEEARRLLDRAMETLPVATPLLDLNDLERRWFAAAEAARVLADWLAAPSDDGLGLRAETLRVALGPFSPPSIAARAVRLARPAAVLGPADLREIHALLATPLPVAESRAALWKTGIDLERTLAAATLAPDPGAGATDPGRPLDEDSEPATRRARISLALLALSGSGLDNWGALAGFASEPGRSAEARDRVSRLVSPWLESPELDDPATDATRLRRSEEFARLRHWLASRYAFEARDPARSDFFAEAAVDFAGPGDRPGAWLAIDAGPPSAILDPDRREAIFRIGLRTDAPSPSGSAEVEVVTADDDWLDIKLGTRPAARLVVQLDAGPVEIPLTIGLRPESVSSKSPIPPGVLIRVRRDGRTYHHPLPLRIEPESRRPRLIFAASPTGPAPLASEVRLRATRGKTPFSIFVRNPGDRDRRFAVELADRRGAIAGASATLSVKGGETARVSFGPPPVNPDAGVVEVLGSLVIRLVDVDDPAFRLSRTIPVGLASPSDYLRVVLASYTPTGLTGGEKPRLEFKIQATEGMAGPPCIIGLSLPADRIPGLISAGQGTLQIKLEKPGDAATLFAEDFTLDPRGDEWGFVHLAVDGVERSLVYRTKFTRRGIANTPTRDLSPAVRLKAGRVASATAPLKVEVEVDNPPEAGKLRLALGQYTGSGPDEGFRADSDSVGDSSRAIIRLNLRGPEGALIFEAIARDASTTIEVGQIRGRRIVRAWLKDERDDLKASDDLPLVLDDRPPTAVRFESLPQYGLRGGLVALKASGQAPDSGIKEVAFFAGRPVDGKRPPGAAVVLGKPAGSSRSTWAASLPLVDAKLGPQDVSVEFLPGVGPSRFETATITIVESIPIEPGKIAGTVKEGDRPQPGFQVFVYDDKKAEKGKATTDDEGNFEVANLAPGAYQVFTSKATPPTEGTVKVTVKAGETARAEVPMFRKIP